MTKSFDSLAVESLQGLTGGMAFSKIASQMHGVEASETPVLDLSCKRSPPPPCPSDFFKIPLLGETPTYLEHQQETNNNDNKHVNGYQHSESAKMRLTHQYQSEEASTFPSNHERKSPFESRSYVMTPPSESDSPKKPRIQPFFDHTNIMSDSIRHPVYNPTPMMPLNVPMSLPISVPPVMPTLVPQSSPVPSSAPLQMPPASSPTSHEVSQASAAAEEAKKTPRPFKAYPKDPMSATLGPDMMFDQELKKAYSDFRSRMLDSVKRTNEGTNVKMRRVSKSPNLPSSTCDEKDAAYWERRRKNNEAAKRSRDARRAKEDEIAIRAAFLEQEYIRLKYENAVLRDENTKMKCLVYRH